MAFSSVFMSTHVSREEFVADTKEIDGDPTGYAGIVRRHELDTHVSAKILLEAIQTHDETNF